MRKEANLIDSGVQEYKQGNPDGRSEGIPGQSLDKILIMEKLGIVAVPNASPQIR